MRAYVGKLFACVFVTSQVSLATRIQATRLPSGPTKVIEAPTGDATTTYFLEAKSNSQHPTGVLTSIVDTFINQGTTTEYMTQHKGTHMDGIYVKIQTTSSREYYRINPTATLDYANSPVRPTGLIGSSTRVEIHGPTSTFHTVEEYRTYVDGHYAHLVSSISNVVTDPAHISPTPIFRPAGLNSDHFLAEQEIKKSLYSSYDFDVRPSKSYKLQHATRTIGKKIYPYGSIDALELENEIEGNLYEKNSARIPRQNDLNDLQAIESDTFEVKVDPDRPEMLARPTYTVGENGVLHFPTPSIEAVRPEAKVVPTQAHRFAAPVKATKSSLDSVTYVGFVDFTTTIDDTVVIFRPKKTFNTETRNLVRPDIEPTRSFEPVAASSVASRQDFPRQHPGFKETTPEIVSSTVPEEEKHSIDEENFIDTTSSIEKNEVKKHTSGIDALKSLLASSRRPKFGRTSSSSVSSLSSSLISSSSFPSVSRPVLTSSQVQPSRSSILRPSRVSSSGIVSSAITNEEQFTTTDPPIDLLASIDPTSDVELVFKTLYTTYTYFTTFFRESTTRVKSREEVISNVITLTNILKSTDLPSISSSCAQDSTCLFKPTESRNIQELSEEFEGTIGRPSSRIVEEAPRSNNGRVIPGDELIRPSNLELDVNAVLKTFYTTYTYFSTLFVDGTSSVSTRTEVYSNVQTASVDLDIINSDSISIRPSSSYIETKPSPTKKSESSSSRKSIFPIRRLEISSVRPVELHSELAAIDGEEEVNDIERPSTDRIPTVNNPTTTPQTEEEDTTTEWIQPTPIITTTTLEDEEDYNTITQETPALTEEVTEVTTSATTESEEDISSEEVTEFVPRTLYTTFTYFTTLFKDGSSVVTSNLETITNVMTDAFVEPTTIEPSVTFFTTFTYWTTSIDGDNTVITSREETITDILPASVTDDLSLKDAIRATQAPELSASSTGDQEDLIIESTIAPSLSAGVNVFTFYQTNYDGDETIVETILSTSSPVSTATPEIQSGEPDVISSTPVETPDVSSTISPTSSFQDEDNDLVLTREEEEDEEGNNDDDTGVKPTRSRVRGFTRPGNTFTPIIRPLLRDRKPGRIFRPSNRVSTTVATRTRNSVKPTLIATPASSAPQPTPSFGASSRPGFLASSSLFQNRGQSRFSSQFPNQAFSSGSGSSSISPSAALQSRGSVSATASLSPTEPPSVVISPIKLRRPNPFRARLKERQQQRLQSLRNKNNRLRVEARPTANTIEENNSNPIPIPNLPTIPGGNAPIFVSSQRQTIAPSRRVPKGDTAIDSIEVPDNIAARRERARERIKSLFSRRRPAFGRTRLNDDNEGQQSRRKRQQLSEKLVSFFQ